MNEQDVQKLEIQDFTYWLYSIVGDRMLEKFKERMATESGRVDWDKPENADYFGIRSLGKFESDPLDSLVLHAIWYWHKEGKNVT